MHKLIALIMLLVTIMTCNASTIEFTVHHGSGGPSDKVTRLISQKLPKDYVVINRPGAQGKIAVRQILTSDSLMVATLSQILVTNMLSSNPGYTEDDLELIAVVGAMPSLLVCNKKHNFSKYSDFVSYKGSLNFGIAGYGSSEHISTEILLSQLPTTHQVIPYAQGGATSLIDLLAGNIDCMFANYPLVAGHINDPRLSVLLSSHTILSNVLTWKTYYKEDFPVQSLLGIVVSKNLNNAIRQKIIGDINVVFASASISDNIALLGLFPMPGTNKKAIDTAIANNTKTKQFIIKHNLRLN